MIEACWGKLSVADQRSPLCPARLTFGKASIALGVSPFCRGLPALVRHGWSACLIEDVFGTQ